MFVGRKQNTGGEIIATSANEIVQPKIQWRYKNVVLYSSDPPFLLKEGLGTETMFSIVTLCVSKSK